MADDIQLGADLELKGLNQFLTGLKKVQGEGDKTGKSLSGMQKAGKFMRGLGGAARKVGGILGKLAKIGVAFTLGLAGGLGVALSKFGEFELQMARVGTLLEPGRKGMQEFGATVNRASVQFAQDAGVMADAVFQSISAGVDASTESVEAFTKVVGTAAVGGFTDAATVVDGLTTAMNAFGVEAGTASEISDKFFIANKLGKTTFDELSKSLGRVAPTAKALGVSLDEVLAATVSLTKGGTKTSEVMSGLKAVFASIKQPSKDASAAAEELKINFSLAGLQSKGLAGFMQDLTEKTKGNTIAQAQLFGSIEAFNAVARLASEEGAKDFTESLDKMKKAGGESAAAMERVTNTTGFKLKQIKQGFSRFTREIGAGLAEGFGINEISNIPDAIEDASATLRSAAGSFATSFRTAFAPAAAFGAMDLTGMAKSMGTAVAKLANGFISMLKALPGVVSGIGEVVKGLSVALGFVSALMKIGADSQGDVAGKKAIKKGGGSTIRGIGGAAPVATVATTMAAGKGQYGEEVKAGVLLAMERGRKGAALRTVAARLINETSAERQAASARQQAAASQQKRAKSGQFDTDRAGNVLFASGTGASAGGESIGTSAAGARSGGVKSEFVMAETNVVVNNTTEIAGQKKKDPPRRFGSRGRGAATIEATARRKYIVFENQVQPISDEFIFSSMVDATGV